MYKKRNEIGQVKININRTSSIFFVSLNSYFWNLLGSVCLLQIPLTNWTKELLSLTYKALMMTLL